MFGLAQKVGSNPVRVILRIGNDQDFGGAGNHVYPHHAIKLPLRFGDPGIARASHHIDGRNPRRAVSQCGDGLRAADPPHFIHA
jgi:hypothetical protein